MFEWSEEQVMIRDAVRRFVEEEVEPNIDDLEHGEPPPTRSSASSTPPSAMDQLARDRFKRQLERKPSGRRPSPRGTSRAGGRRGGRRP